MLVKLISKEELNQDIVNTVISIYKTNTQNVNGALLRTIPEFKSMGHSSSGDVLYFCDQRTKNPVIKDIEV